MWERCSRRCDSVYGVSIYEGCGEVCSGGGGGVGNKGRHMGECMG